MNRAVVAAHEARGTGSLDHAIYSDLENLLQSGGAVEGVAQAI